MLLINQQRRQFSGGKAKVNCTNPIGLTLGIENFCSLPDCNLASCLRKLTDLIASKSPIDLCSTKPYMKSLRLPIAEKSDLRLNGQTDRQIENNSALFTFLLEVH